MTVDSLAFGGRGVARHGELVVFVSRALPGDRVRARVTKLKRRHAEARTIEVLEPGPGRVPARCAHFGVCGGCAWQDLEYAEQVRHKAPQVDDALRRLGRIEDRARADRAGGRAVRLPQQARVLVGRRPARAVARLPPRRALGRAGAGRDLPHRLAGRKRRPPGVRALGARGRPARLRRGDRRGLPAPPRRARGRAQHRRAPGHARDRARGRCPRWSGWPSCARRASWASSMP